MCMPFLTVPLDHPHIHGEYLIQPFTPATKLGSPPHTWGIPTGRFKAITPPRITPTYMGNTLTTLIWKATCGDHPHIHGEYYPIYVIMTGLPGSPPHTWGIRMNQMSQQLSSRITPTYMGNTRFSIIAGSASWDHPHIHGEYSYCRCPIPRGRGSPPHTWGIQ